jgi:hypothetical protein
MLRASPPHSVQRPMVHARRGGGAALFIVSTNHETGLARPAT